MTTDENTTTTIVVREPLDPTPEQLLVLKRYANASRASFNFAFGLMDPAQRRWDRGRDRLVLEGLSWKEANRKAPKTFVPRASDVQRIFGAVREEPMLGPLREGETEYRRLYRWWAGVNAIVCQRAFRDAETAFANWRSSSRRAGDAVGYPRLKRVGRCRDSFRMTSVRLVASDLRHVRIGGEKDRAGQRALIVRLHRPARRLARVIARGGVVKMVTVAREGSQWWASFNVRIDLPAPVQPSRRQKGAGTVGVDLGVAVFAATSEPVLTAAGKVQLFDNPRYLDNARRQLRKWERRMARRYVKGLPARRQSAGWREARDQVAHLSACL
ncbi:hypothetical protein ACFWH1_10835 [Streptomyces sp. NPDC127037]|uniref:hypothetical protein n=1 Tax=Streptomyces sp. NPDC127037 TaxID=3347113 RepID=UPI00365F41B5